MAAMQIDQQAAAPVAKAVQINRRAAEPAGAVSSFDAVLACMGEGVGRVEVRQLSEADRALARMFAGAGDGLGHPRLNRAWRRA